MEDSKEVNILITSIGNDASLVKCFTEAYETLWIEWRVVSIDCNEHAPWVFFSDVFYQVDPIGSDLFLKQLEWIIQQENISLIIPDRDADIVFYSENRELIEGWWVKICVPSKEIAKVCDDKFLFYKYLSDNWISTIKTYEKIEDWIKYPCIIKPRDWSGSEGFRKIGSKKELETVDNLGEYVIQDLIEWTEFTIDYFADFDARPISIVPRIRLKVVNWESYLWLTKNNKEIIKECKCLWEIMKLVWHNTLQCFLTKKNEIIFIENNARFWWGAPLWIAAWCKSPEWFLRIMQWEKIKPSYSFTNNLKMIRFTDNIFVDNNE